MTVALLLALGTTITVSPAGPVRTLTAALEAARPGDRIVVQGGRYREPGLVVRVTVAIVGEGQPIIQGGAHSTIRILADGVEIRGLIFDQVTPSATEDRAATYAKMLRESYAQIKQLRPDVTVLGGATAGIPLPYWEKLMQNGGLQSMDALSIHPYRYNAPPEGLETEVAALQTLVRV